MSKLCKHMYKIHINKMLPIKESCCIRNALCISTIWNKTTKILINEKSIITSIIDAKISHHKCQNTTQCLNNLTRLSNYTSNKPGLVHTDPHCYWFFGTEIIPLYLKLLKETGFITTSADEPWNFTLISDNWHAETDSPNH